MTKTVSNSDIVSHQIVNEWVRRLGFMKTEISSFFANDMNTYQVVMTLQKNLQFAIDRLLKDRNSVPPQIVSALLTYVCDLLRDLGFTELERKQQKNDLGMIDELCRFRSDIRQRCIQGDDSQIRRDVLTLCDELRLKVREMKED